MTVTRSAGTRSRARRDESELERHLHDQHTLVAALRQEVAELRSLVNRSQRETMRRIDELYGAARDAAVSLQPLAPTSHEARPMVSRERPLARATPVPPFEYRRIVTRIHTLVRTVVPAGATVAVVSRGDPALVDLEGRDGWHFPRTEDGRYAGHHPENSDAAIAHLEQLRALGAYFLLVPITSGWWLEYYDRFHHHLSTNYRVVVNRDDACAIFALDQAEVAR